MHNTQTSLRDAGDLNKGFSGEWSSPRGEVGWIGDTALRP